MQENESKETYCTIREVADELRVAESTVWRWVDRGLVPAYRLPGRRIRIKKSDVEKAMIPTQRPAEAENEAQADWQAWIVDETGVGLDPPAAIEKSKELMRRRLGRGGRSDQPVGETAAGALDPRRWVEAASGAEEADPLAVLADARRLQAKMRARRGGLPLPSSVDDIGEMREERSREMDRW